MVSDHLFGEWSSDDVDADRRSGRRVKTGLSADTSQHRDSPGRDAGDPKGIASQAQKKRRNGIVGKERTPSRAVKGRNGIPALPHTQRVTPCSSSSASGSVLRSSTMSVCSLSAMIVSMARSRTGFSFSLPFRFVRPLPFWRGVTPLVVPLEAVLWGSSGGSSRSSCFVRFLEEVEEDERLAVTRRGADSELGESGDLEVLVEPEGALRLPERRVSRGERGGPIIATWAMNGGMGRGRAWKREGERGTEESETK